MNYISTTLFAFIVVLFVSSCKNDKQEPNAFLHLKTNVIEEQFGECDGNSACGEIKIDYPIFSGNNEVVDDKLNSEVTNSISSFYNVKTVVETPIIFIADFTEFVKEFPDAANNKWNISMEYQVIKNTTKVLSLSFYMEGYTGGAHGFSTLTYTNYNPKSGGKLKLEDIITDVDKLRLIARESFIKENDLDPSESLNTQGFWFIDDIFSLNNNFIISDEGISFHYNQYEIAPYSQGPIDVNIPMSKLEELLK